MSMFKYLYNYFFGPNPKPGEIWVLFDDSFYEDWETPNELKVLIRNTGKYKVLYSYIFSSGVDNTSRTENLRVFRSLYNKQQ